MKKSLLILVAFFLLICCKKETSTSTTPIAATESTAIIPLDAVKIELPSEKIEEVLHPYPDTIPKAKEFQVKAIAVAQYAKTAEKDKANVDEVVKTKAIAGFLARAKGFGTPKGGCSVSYMLQVTLEKTSGPEIRRQI